MLPHPLSLLQLLLLTVFALAQNWKATPFIPPAIPLAVKSPYLQTWMQQGKSEGSLNSGWETFRDGSVNHLLGPLQQIQLLTIHAYIQITAWLGIVRVDSNSCVWMGDPQGKKAAVQKDMTVRTPRPLRFHLINKPQTPPSSPPLEPSSQ